MKGRAHTLHSIPPLASPRERELCDLEDYTCLTGESLAMRCLRAQLRRVAAHFRVALITGEPGTCKETVALALHRLGAESDATFRACHADALRSHLADLLSPLAPSTASVQSPPFEGLDWFGNGSSRATLYVFGAADLTASHQAQLRRSLQQLGTACYGQARPRLIFSSSRDLRALASTGRFDRALYRIISAVDILLPPLRSRPQDIPLITCNLLGRHAAAGRTFAAAFDGRALARLQRHDWPQNIRELERVVGLAQPASAHGEDGVIDEMQLPTLGEFTMDQNEKASRVEARVEARVERLDDVVHNHVLDVLLRCSGNKVRAAERLGISRSTLYRMLDPIASPGQYASEHPDFACQDPK